MSRPAAPPASHMALPVSRAAMRRAATTLENGVRVVTSIPSPASRKAKVPAPQPVTRRSSGQATPAPRAPPNLPSSSTRSPAASWANRTWRRAARPTRVSSPPTAMRPASSVRERMTSPAIQASRNGSPGAVQPSRALQSHASPRPTGPAAPANRPSAAMTAKKRSAPAATSWRWRLMWRPMVAATLAKAGGACLRATGRRAGGLRRAGDLPRVELRLGAVLVRAAGRPGRCFVPVGLMSLRPP